MKKVIFVGLLLSLVSTFIIVKEGHAIEVDGQEKVPSLASQYSKACDGGRPMSCNNLGVLYEQGKDVKKIRLKPLSFMSGPVIMG